MEELFSLFEVFPLRKHFQILIAYCLALAAAVVGAHGSAPPKPEPISEQSWHQVRSLRGIATQDGMTTPSLYVFFDPNCPFSAKLWLRQVGGKPFADVSAVWIPVTYLEQSSLGRGAALLRAIRKEELARNFRDANIEYRQGAVTAVTPTDAERLALGRSKAVWIKLGSATPMLVYRSKSGGAHAYRGGPPVDKTAEFISQIAPSNLDGYSDK
jgi:thiol:disulfide interchange protein DsbG